MSTTNRKSLFFIRIALVLILIVGFSFPAVTSAGAIGPVIYVVPSGLTTGSCSSWANACNLQYALGAASSSSALWVKKGTYRPTSSTNRAVSFVLKNGVALYGGFAGTETLLTQRNASTNITILSGDIGVLNNNSDNSYHVVVGGGTNNTAILDGFSIQGGNANIDPNTIGGGMFNSVGSPTLTNLTFSGNSATYGGGMSNFSGSNPILTNVTFSSNSATSLGGGMYNSGSSPTLTNVTFNGNSAAFGGGMNNSSSSNPTLKNVTFNGNSATSSGGGMSNSGSSPKLTNVTISGNSAASFGGGLFNGSSSNPIVTNSIMYGDTGGEISNISSSSPTVSYSVVQGGYPGTGNLNANPLLGLLANNGGLTKTMALNNGSPAINAGTNANCPATDQRGVTRPQGSHCDIGSFEYVFPANVQVNIAGANMGNYIVPAQTSIRPSYAGLNNGLVKVVSTNNIPIVASQRVAYMSGGNWTSFSELMGLPANQLSSSYTFPWYNNLDLNSQLRFGNAGTANTTVTVTIGGIVRGSYPLVPNQSERVSYAGLDKGPVKIQSSGGVPIIASLRVAYNNGSAWTSFSELMGLPSGQLTTTYLFPWYNNADLNSQLRFGNVGNANTTVTVIIGGVVRGSYPLVPNQSQRVSYAGLNSGPVKIQSTGGVPIIASVRVAYHNGSAWTNYSEMMGLPLPALSTNYSFPIYDNVNHDSQLRFGNVGTSNTTVTVKINGLLKGNYVLAPNQSQRVSYAGLDSGPVVIQSSGNIPIIASERVAYFNGSAWTSFAEMMGLPKAQLTTTYLFPWYNNVDLNTQLRFGVP